MTKWQILFTGSIAVFLILGFLTPAAFAADAWCNTAKCDFNWQYRKLITIDYTKVGTDNNSGYITDFPFLVTFTGSDFTEVESNTQISGADIRFTDQQGNDLEYEIEEYDEVANKMVIWVKSNSPGIAKHENTLLYMYYGNSGASSTANAGLVWDSNYKAVYHLNDDFLDSTSNNHDGTNGGTTNIAGQIADAQDFSVDQISVSTSSNSLDVVDFTLEAWVNADTFTSNARIFASTGNFYSMLASSSLSYQINNQGHNNIAATTLSTGEWTHIVVTFSDSANKINFYINGVLDANEYVVNESVSTGITSLSIGSLGGLQAFDGAIDEPRISNIVRSADFIKTEYNNQNSPSTFYSVGIQENVIGPPTFTADRTDVNTIVLTFSENVDTTTTDGSGYTLSTGTVSSNTNPAGSSNIMTLVTSGISGTSATPTVTYTQAAGTTVDGDANEVENNFNTIATDSIAPTFTADRTGLNTIVLTFSENVDTTTTDGSGYTLSTGTVSSNTNPAGSSNIMTLVTSGISGTSTISVTYTQAAGTIVDGDANEVENNFNTIATDSIAPTFTADRTGLNTIVLTFSENVSGNTIANSFTVDGTSSVTNTAPSNSPTVTLTTVGLTTIDSSLLVTYVAATGNITDQASNEVANGENANTPYTAPPGAWCNTAKCDSTWQYRKLITIDYTKVGTDNNSGYLVDFPFLVTFTGSDFTDVESNTQSSGADIRFTDQPGNDLEYEIEKYDEVANEMAIWVKSNSPGIAKHENTILYMYYGNSDASSTANAGLVWDSNYKAVYHMNQSTFGASSTLDSTLNNNVGTPSTMDSADAVSGVVGGAVDFDGTSDLISIPDAVSLDIAGTITIQGWIKTTDISNFPMLLSKGSVNTSYLVFARQGSGDVNFRLMTPGYTDVIASSITDNVFHHVVGTYDGTIMRVYVDGVEDSTNNVGSITITPNNNPLYLGSASTNFYMTGILDEIRISNIARSADFIKTEYNNQNSPSTFYSVGSEEVIPPPTLTITSIPGTPSSTKTSLVYTFQFNEDVTGFTSADITLNFAGAGAVDGSIFTTTDANTYTLTLAGQDLTDLGTLTNSQTIVASVDMTGLTSINSIAGVGTEQNTWTYNTGPSTPPSLLANQGNTQISLTWPASTSGIGPITDYIVEYKQSSSGTWLTFNDGVSTSTSATVTGLTNDLSYDFRVSAESSGVFGSASSTVTIAPAVTTTKATQSFSTSSNLLFDDVTVVATGSGSVTIEKLNSNPESSEPSRTIVGSFFDITSSGTISDRTITLSYSDADVTGVDESSLIIYRFSGGAWSALITTVDTGANTATATTPGFSSFVLGGPSSAASSSNDDIKPSYSITFDEDEYPISIGDTEFKFKDLGFDNPITIIETGKPILVNLLVYDNEGPSYIDKVELYTNLNGLFRNVDQSDTSIIYQRGNQLEILDPNGFFSDVTISAIEVNQKLQITYKITFAKEMELSDIIVQTRDVGNNVAVLTVSDAWQIIQDPATVEEPEPIIVELADVSLPINLKVRELTVEKPSYFTNEEILFSGTVIDDKSDSVVSIIIRDPSNDLLTTIRTFHDKEGYFEARLDTDSKFKTDGTYTVTAFTDELNKSMQTTFYFSRDGSSESMMFGGKMKVEQLKEDKIEAGATSDWTSIPGFIADDIDDLHIWYDISGQVASWVSPQKLDFGVASAREDFLELSWSISVPKNTSPGFYTFEWVEQCVTITGIPCVSQDLQFRIQVVPSTSIPDPLSGTITFLIGIAIAIGVFVGSFFILGKKVHP